MRLSTRLSLSYIGFVALLGVLVLILAGIQVYRLTSYAKSLPSPASASDAVAIADHLAREGLAAPIPAALLKQTLAAGGWAQVVDDAGHEVQVVNAPDSRSRSYTPAELAGLAREWAPHPNWYMQLAPVNSSNGIDGVVVLAAPRRTAGGEVALRLPDAFGTAFSRYFFAGVGMAVLAAVALALAAGFLYARGLARPIVRLAEELKVAAAGDFSHRIPVRGKDEFATLSYAYNHLVERLSEAERERARTEQARRDLVANISHDLRTPLTSIQGFTEAMADAATPPEIRVRNAAIVADRIRQLDGLLTDLLELSRLQALPQTHKAPADLPELVREQVIALMPELEQAGLEVDVDLPDELPTAPVDSRLIGRALQNLLTNALRHSGGAHRLGVALIRSGEGVAIEVSDDGQGIPAADLPMLFERYYQGTSATNRSRGTGLGLAIVRQIAENHGGRVAVQSEAGHGTKFTLWLPLSG